MFEFNKVYHFDLKNTFSFGDLNSEEMVDIMLDGRVSSHFMERQLTKWFPNLTHISGCKEYDHVDTKGRKFDAKNFTPNGCKFMPSSMLGTGRKFDQKMFESKAKQMNYIICDITGFPAVRVLFKSGKSLVSKYSKGVISKTKKGALFGE